MPTTDLPDDPDRTDLADTRTAWAEDRTALANERTFAGWIRTGIACVAIALGFQALFKNTSHPVVAKTVAELFVFAGVLVFWAAALNSRKTRQRMKAHDVETHSQAFMAVLASILTVASISAGVVLWFL